MCPRKETHFFADDELFADASRCTPTGGEGIWPSI